MPDALQAATEKALGRRLPKRPPSTPASKTSASLTDAISKHYTPKETANDEQH
ncbi:hypothetical protein AAFP30_22345 [Gordonia sp. CPCC 205515]|uniref:hypothetical protein n=1 Tax=Gordonia sp. CPCC 205515 TaxID=3140791 RepID=UPI003AF37C27